MDAAKLQDMYADVMVRCPMPGQEHLPAERLGDFIATEVGQKVLGEAFATMAELTDNGIDPDKAATIVLKFAAVKDENGDLLRAPKPEEAELATAGHIEAESSKKK